MAEPTVMNVQRKMQVKLELTAEYTDPVFGEVLGVLAKHSKFIDVTQVNMQPERTEAGKPAEEAPAKKNTKAKAEKPAPKKEAATEVDIEAVRAAAKSAFDGSKHQEVAALLKEFGASNLTEVDASDYAKLLEKLEAL